MRIRERALPLLVSLLLPALALSLLLAFTIGAVVFAANDRAILWAEGTPAQLGEMQRRVADNPWFKHGRVARATVSNPLPPGCGAGAREYSFASLGEVEGQVAREILEMIAAQSGAGICLSNVFMINELPGPEDQTWTQQSASALLGTSILPGAMVLFVFFALSARLRLATLLGEVGQWTQALSWGIGAGLATSALLALGVTLLPGATGDLPPAETLTVGTVGYSLAIALVLVVPITHEVAFRGWLMPLAQRGIGAVPAALLSSTLYAAASFPADAWGALGYFLLGAICSALYLRTRSLLACIIANVLASLTLFWVT